MMDLWITRIPATEATRCLCEVCYAVRSILTSSWSYIMQVKNIYVPLSPVASTAVFSIAVVLLLMIHCLLLLLLFVRDCVWSFFCVVSSSFTTISPCTSELVLYFNCLLFLCDC